jgi:hypothetical protein
MADRKDFYEDNKEFYGQYLDALASRRQIDRTTTPVAPPLQFCPLCHTAFIGDGELSEHIRSVHGRQHIYLRVNGRIIRDLGWAEQGISELKLVQLGFPNAAVELIAPGFRKEFPVSGDEDLRRRLPAGFEGELSIRVTPVTGSARQFTVYSRSLPEFRRDDLDAMIQRITDEDLQPGRTPDIGRWRSGMGDLEALAHR